MTTDFSSLQRAALSLVGALFISTLFIGSTVVPAQAETTSIAAPAR